MWFDTQTGAAPLTGSLAALGALPNLTFLQASNNAGLGGAMPARLCSIKCSAGGDTGISCDKALPAGCCGISTCGAAPPAPPPPPSTMGECFPQ